MDLPSLAVVLRAALSHAPEERKSAEASLNQVSPPSPPLVPLSYSRPATRVGAVDDTPAELVRGGDCSLQFGSQKLPCTLFDRITVAAVVSTCLLLAEW
jgi:hypothetical protein